MNNFWNERYSAHEYAFGTEPNVFFAGELRKLPRPGHILFPCEGEGRNAVYAAEQGWTVEAFDLSEMGKRKALQWAQARGVELSYHFADALTEEYPAAMFDAIALIYAHFSAADRRLIHRKMVQWLKPGGTIILEAFHPDQLGFSSGGPKDPTMLYTEALLAEDFEELHTDLLVSEHVTLEEGKYHQGPAAIVRFVGHKQIL